MTDWRDAVRRGDITAEGGVRECLERIEALDGRIGAFLQVFQDRALEQAREIDARLAGGASVGPLAGVPVALKDNICLDHGRTTCASRMLERYESPFSATAAARLEAAGAIIIGKTNMDEFAMGSSTENSALGVTRNPWDESRVPGGSSGGSAAAVAARMVPAALGSDTGGSVRQPAAFCGVVGVKPTYGVVSRWGLVAYASSLDQIGPITRRVTDAALLLEVIGGRDVLDSTCAQRDAPALLADLEAPIEGLRLAIPAQCRSSKNQPSVAAAFDRAIETFRGLGAMIVDVELPTLDHGVAAYYIVALAEASSNLARYDGVRYGHRAEPRPGDDIIDLYTRSRTEGFGPEVQRRIMLGTYTLSSGYYDAYYLTALKARRLIKSDFDRVFNEADCHAVLMPTAPSPAFRLGEKTTDPIAMYLEDIYTVTANLAGIPAMSVPAGLVSQAGAELPVGVQILCPAFEDGRMLRIGRMLERAMPEAALAPKGM